jgi:hypothetical protein
MNYDSIPHPARMAHFIRETRETRGPGEQRTPSARAEYFAANGRTATTRTTPAARPVPTSASHRRFAARDAADMRRLLAKRHVRLDAAAPRLTRPC